MNEKQMRLWTDEQPSGCEQGEVATLARMFRTGVALHVLVRRLHLSEASILFHLHRLGGIESPDIPAFEFTRQQAEFLHAERSYLDEDVSIGPSDSEPEGAFDEDEASSGGPDVEEEQEQTEVCVDWSICFDDMDADQWEELMSIPEIEDSDIYTNSSGLASFETDSPDE